MKKVLLYLALVFLIILLLLPVGLRLFGKNLYQESNNNKPKNVYGTLSCTKLNEKINQTYLNGKPYNLWYQIIGSFGSNTGEVDESNQTALDLKDYATISYSDISMATDYKIDFNNYSSLPEGLEKYGQDIDNQANYYNILGFMCTKTINEK